MGDGLLYTQKKINYLERGGVTVRGVGLMGIVWGGVLLIDGGEAEPEGDGATAGVVVVVAEAVKYEGMACMLTGGLKDGGKGCCSCFCCCCCWC